METLSSQQYPAQDLQRAAKQAGAYATQEINDGHGIQPGIQEPFYHLGRQGSHQGLRATGNGEPDRGQEHGYHPADQAGHQACHHAGLRGLAHPRHEVHHSHDHQAGDDIGYW